MSLWLLISVAALAVYKLWLFNRLVRLRNRARGAWADIDVQLKRRHDLVGNLVETVLGYAAHERQTLTEVTEARTRAEHARTVGAPAEAGRAEARLTGRVGALFAVAEGYPDLLAGERFTELQRVLVEVEGALENARRYYNAVVRDLNTRIQSFPDVIVARIFGFAEREFFELDDPIEAAAPRLDLGARE